MAAVFTRIGTTSFSYNQWRYFMGAIEKGYSRTRIRNYMRSTFNKGFRDSTFTVARSRFKQSVLQANRINARIAAEGIQAAMNTGVFSAAPGRGNRFMLRGIHTYVKDGEVKKMPFQFTRAGPTEEYVLARAEGIGKKRIHDSLQGFVLADTEFTSIEQWDIS